MRRSRASRRSKRKWARGTPDDSHCRQGRLRSAPRPCVLAAVPGGGRDWAPVTQLHVNGTSYDVATHPSAALLWALRDEVGCSSVKYGCGAEQCGACRVLIDGAPAYSCTTTVADARGRDITTLESLVA